MNTIPSSTAARPEPNVLANFQYSKLNRASVDVQASAGITLVTADGDKVTLNASSSLQASLQTYDYLGRSQGQTLAVHGEAFQLSARNSLAVAVEGSLDEEELKDIKKLLDTLSSVSKNFFAGNNQGGLQHLAQLADLDSIASFEANFNYTKQITAVAISQLSSTAPAQTTEDSATPRTAPTDDAPATDSFIEQLTTAAKRLDSGDNFAKIPKRFAHLFKQLARQLPLDDDDKKLAEKIERAHSKRGHSHSKDEPAQAANGQA